MGDRESGPSIEALLLRREFCETRVHAAPPAHEHADLLNPFGLL
jgi:hypothetical protein